MNRKVIFGPMSNSFTYSLIGQGIRIIDRLLRCKEIIKIS